MEKQNHWILSLLYALILGAFLLLMVQSKYHFAKERKLEGAFQKTNNPPFLWRTWFNEDYQSKKETYLNENFGFRNFFVRLNNQIAFSFFNYARANGVLVGKDAYLYEESYINSYLGHDFLGEDSIRKKVERMKFVADKLQNVGVDLLLVIAPGKGSFFPEYIPDKYAPEVKTTTNHEVFVQELQKEAMPFIDFNSWFIDQKGKRPYPLYPKTGIHWSRYGEIIVGDSILGYINQWKGLDLPRMIVDSIALSEKPKYTDNDIEKGMNLMFTIDNYPMAYPSYHKKEGRDKIRGLTVADSYYWGLFGSGYAYDYLDNGQFWYYNEQIHEHGQEARNVNDVDIEEEIRKHQLVILLLTEANLYRFAFGFIDDLYLLYTDNSQERKSDRIKKFEAMIRGNKEWMEKMQGYATEKGVSLDEEIRSNAEYMVWKEDNP